MLLATMLVCFFPTATEGARACHICGSGGNSLMKYPKIVLKGVGKTCSRIAIDIAKTYKAGTGKCSTAQKRWFGRCCSGRRPNGNAQVASRPVKPSVRYVGPNKRCAICRDGDYPYKTSMVINMLYIGEGSCAQYYKYGMEGRIQNHLCQSLQYFAYEPCGCGKFNPFFKAPANTGNKGKTPQTTRAPDPDAGKDCQKLSGNRGGAGGGQCHGGRKLRYHLKGREHHHHEEGEVEERHSVVDDVVADSTVHAVEVVDVVDTSSLHQGDEARP
jgi:hypothetical protein